MARLTLTVEYRNGRPSKSVHNLYPEEVVAEMRGLSSRVACGEFVAVYITREKPLDMRKENGNGFR